MTRWTLAIAVALPFVVGCQSPDTRPDAMTAAEHRDEAARHREEAAREEQKFDPGAAELVNAGTPASPDAMKTINPTSKYHDAAVHELAEAKAHERAAAKLEKMEGDACANIAPVARGACPVIGTLSVVEKINGGARVKLRDLSKTAGVVERMRCHAAFAQKNGREGLETCPLYVDGLKIDVEGDWILFRSDKPGAAQTLLDLLQEHVAVPPGT